MSPKTEAIMVIFGGNHNGFKGRDHDDAGRYKAVRVSKEVDAEGIETVEGGRAAGVKHTASQTLGSPIEEGRAWKIGAPVTRCWNFPTRKASFAAS